MNAVRFRDLGRIDYKEAWDLQKELLEGTIERKTFNRKKPEEEGVETEDHLIFCEHPPVYTLGKSGSREHILISDQEMEERGIGFYHIDRGGDITYHGPGQLVAYPVIDLDHYFTDIGRYLRTLEEAVIRTLRAYGIEGERSEGATGVWLNTQDPVKARKICAMGVKCSRWVTMHGIALNVNNDLSYFDHIVPCGIPDKGVTSIREEVGKEVSMDEVKRLLKREMGELFGMTFIDAAS
jgi:lipoyl(octanoyl) transferase